VWGTQKRGWICLSKSLSRAHTTAVLCRAVLCCVVCLSPNDDNNETQWNYTFGLKFASSIFKGEKVSKNRTLLKNGPHHRHFSTDHKGHKYINNGHKYFYEGLMIVRNRAYGKIKKA
jgi:hypothetical protein